MLQYANRRDYTPQGESLQAHFPGPSYDLVDQIGLELELPDLHTLSLNRAWPLMQDVNGGMVKARQCANPNCNILGDSSLPGSIGTGQLLPLAGLLSPRLYNGCIKFARSNGGSMRTQEGTSNEFWSHELIGKRDNINNT
ncbi:hypothetical protein FDECE_49 [Fusarium decemcellulare]|nr:hypothetical protein FDECE_49 [Fusarium decemcellulare]